MAFLELQSGLRSGERFQITNERTVIGRHPGCDIVIDASAVSRQHCLVTVVSGEPVIEDLRSRNGTSVNGQTLVGKQVLKDGDAVLICDQRLRFNLNAGPSPDRAEGESHVISVDTGLMDQIVESGEQDSMIVSQLEIAHPSSDEGLGVQSEAKLRALIGLNRAVGSSLSLDEVLPKLLDALFEIFSQSERGFVLLADDTSKRMVLRAKKIKGILEPGPLRLSLSLIDQVVQSRHAILSSDATSDSRLKVSDSVLQLRMRSLMCAPFLGVDGSVLGVLHVDTRNLDYGFHAEELEILVGIAGQAAQAIEQALAHDARIGQEHLKRDLELAHRVQQGLLPSKPPEIQGYELFDFYEPAQQIGGDFFGYVPILNDCMAVVLADVSGKGVSAALVMAMLSADVRYCLASERDVAAAVSRINESFCRSGWEDRFATLVVAVIDPHRHTLTVVNAGHLPAYVRNSDGTVQEVGREGSGLPLGLDMNEVYHSCEVAFSPGASLLLCTDGISEAMDHENNCYGLDQLKKILSGPATSAEEVGRRILGDVERHSAGQVRSDDMCLVCVSRVAE